MLKQTADQPSVLPLTSYAVLGLLTQGAASGYDLIKRAQAGIAYFFWSPSRSQIYAELTRLFAGGWVSEQAVEQERRPDKRIYTLTASGEAALRAWLREPLPTDDHRVLLLKLFFGNHSTRADLIAQVQHARRQAQATLDGYRRLEQEHLEHGSDFYSYLTLQSGLAHSATTIAWADRVITQLAEAEE